MEETSRSTRLFKVANVEEDYVSDVMEYIGSITDQHKRTVSVAIAEKEDIHKYIKIIIF
jgi:hypothetical protein